MTPTADYRGCLTCGEAAEMQVYDSRPVQIGTVLTQQRRKRCRKCGAKYKTVEVPADMADDLFTDD